MAKAPARKIFQGPMWKNTYDTVLMEPLVAMEEFDADAYAHCNFNKQYKMEDESFD